MYRPCTSLFSLALVAGVSMISARSATAAEFKVEKHDGGATVKVDGKLFADYRTNLGPKPILWPIIGPYDLPMTRAFPMESVAGEKQDHPHQRSLWFTHGDVNGVDFWSELKGHGSIVHRQYLQLEGGADSAVIATRNDWLDANGKKVCEDERRLVFGVGSHGRTIDFDITLKATEGPLTFGDTKEGAMGIRVPTVMDVNSKKGGQIVTSEGLSDAAAWGKPASWVDYHGEIPISENEKKLVGIAILNHPSSFRYPTRWHVRDYGLFAANPFGLKDFEKNEQLNGSHTVQARESIALRYRFVFHSGDASGIERAFQAYAAEKK
jgi:hypothetical protein